MSGVGVSPMIDLINPISRIPDKSGSFNDVAVKAILQEQAEKVAAGVLEGSGLPSEAVKPLSKKAAETSMQGLSDFASLFTPTDMDPERISVGSGLELDPGSDDTFSLPSDFWSGSASDAGDYPSVSSGIWTGSDKSDISIHSSISRDNNSDISFNPDGTPTSIRSKYFGPADPMYSKLLMMGALNKRTIKDEPIKRENVNKRENQVSNVQQGLAEYDKEVNLFNVKF